MENKLRGQVTRRACELFDENNRLARTIFCLCSASVSNKPTDKLTDTTNMDGEHKNYCAKPVVLFIVFFVQRILVKSEGEVTSGEVASLVFRDSMGKTPK
jgi:hypothetical protein